MDKFLTAVLLTVAILSYRTLFVGGEPGGGREAEQMQTLVTVMASQKEANYSSNDGMRDIQIPMP